MKSDWEEVRLVDCVSILGDGLHGTPVYDIAGDYYFINGNNLQDNRIAIKKETKRVTIAEFEKYKKPLNNRSLLVSINGTLGRIAEYRGENVVLGKSACFFNVIESVDKDFIRYVLTNKDFQDYIVQYATGTTIKNASLKQMREYVFSLPPYHEQRTIASILSCIDNKIENNNEINHHLASEMSATDSSPDMRRGKRTSRKTARLDDSSVRLNISSKSEHTVSLNTLNSSDVGTVTGNCLSSLKLIYFCVLPANRMSIWVFISGLRRKHSTKYTQSSAFEVLNNPTFFIVKLISRSITNEINPTVPIMLMRISYLSTLLRSFILSKSDLLMRFGAIKSTPYGKRCFEVTSGKPCSTAFGESCVPSLISISSLSGVIEPSQQGKVCA